MAARVIGIIITLPLLFWIPGYFITRIRCFRDPVLGRVERALLPVVLSVSVSSLIALALAESGIFSIWLLDLLLVGVSLVVRLWGRKREMRQLQTRGERRALYLLAVLVIIGAVLFFKPMEWVVGANDQGIYFNTGYQVADTGSIVHYDPKIPEMDELEYNTFFFAGEEQFMGFQVKDRSEGKIVPLLFHLLPVWIAIFISLFGKMGGLLVNPLFALLCVWALFSLGSRLVGRLWGAVAVALIVVSFPEIWFARMPAAEILLQFFLVSALLFLVAHLKCPNRLLGTAVGLCLGCAFVTKLESPLFLVPLILVFMVRMFSGRYVREDRYLVNASLLLTACAVIYIRFCSFHYFYYNSIYKTSLKNLIEPRPNQVMLIGFGFLLAVFLLFNIKAIYRLLRRFGRWVGKVAGKAREKGPAVFRGVIAAVVLSVFLFLYIVAPRLTPDYHSYRYNFLKLSWFLGGPLIFIGVIGLCLFIYRNRTETAVLFGFAILVYVYYFHFNITIPDQLPWLIRRNLAVIVPLLIIGMGYLLMLLWRLRKVWFKVIAFALALALFAMFIQADIPMLWKVEYTGANAQLEEVDRLTGDATVGIRDPILSMLVAVPLYYQFHRDYRQIQNLPEPEQLLELSQGFEDRREDLLVVGDQEMYYRYTPEVDFVPRHEYSFTVPRIIRTWDSIPRTWSIPIEDLTFCEAVPGGSLGPGAGKDMEVDVGKDDQGYVLNFSVREGVEGAMFRWAPGLEPELVSRLDEMTREELRVPEEEESVEIPTVKIPLEKADIPVWVELEALEVTRPEGAPPDDMKVYANGHEVGVEKEGGERKDVFRLSIPPEYQEEDFQELKLLITGFRPSDYGGTDVRYLGIPFERIRAGYVR